jgi:putative flippase GtrA
MDRAIVSALDIWRRFTITRYLVASVIALAFDVALFASLVALGMDPTLASALGYCSGIIVHWMVSANIVFTGKTRDGTALHVQRALFAGSALVGLAITVITVELLGRADMHAILAKGFAVGVSFVAVYAMRKWGVFR